MLAAKLASPEYFAVTEWVPTASDEVVNAACLFAFIVPVPIWVVPSRNATVPVGVPLPVFGLTVAVKVTGCPKVAALPEDASAVEVATVWPVPCKVTLCGLPAALSVMVTAPLRVPLSVGVKVTLTVQLAPMPTVVPQLLV